MNKWVILFAWKMAINIFTKDKFNREILYIEN